MKGKSRGARVITYKVTGNKEVYLLTIYDKSELDSIDDNTNWTLKEYPYKIAQCNWSVRTPTKEAAPVGVLTDRNYSIVLMSNWYNVIKSIIRTLSGEH